jgi:hypothetical protein
MTDPTERALTAEERAELDAWLDFHENHPPHVMDSDSATQWVRRLLDAERAARATEGGTDWRICRLHGRAQDDPGHEYKYPDCEDAGYVEAARAEPGREALDEALERRRNGFRWVASGPPAFDGDRSRTPVAPSL